LALWKYSPVSERFGMYRPIPQRTVEDPVRPARLTSARCSSASHRGIGVGRTPRSAPLRSPRACASPAAGEARSWGGVAPVRATSS
jgi:hypothetical protein